MADMTPVDPAGQAVSFLLSVALGAGFGVWYCFFKAVRQVCPAKTLTVFFQDIFFFLTSAVVTYCFFILRCNGEVRFFVYAGIVMGFTVFRVLLSRTAVALLKLPVLGTVKIKSFLENIFAKIVNLAGCGLQKVFSTAKKYLKKFKIRQKRA